LSKLTSHRAQGHQRSGKPQDVAQRLPKGQAFFSPFLRFDITACPAGHYGQDRHSRGHRPAVAHRLEQGQALPNKSLAPLNWTEFNMTNREGVIYAPEGDPRTGFYLEVRELGNDSEEPISEDALLAWEESITESLKALPDAEILKEKRISKESAIGFEYLLTFSEDGAPCKRRMRWLFDGKQLFVIYSQAVPVEDYDVFHNTFEYIYSSFTLGDVRNKILVAAPGQ